MPEFSPLTLLINVLGIVWFVGTAIYIAVRVVNLCEDDNFIYKGIKMFFNSEKSPKACTIYVLIKDAYIHFVLGYMHWYRFVDSKADTAFKSIDKYKKMTRFLQ